MLLGRRCAQRRRPTSGLRRRTGGEVDIFCQWRRGRAGAAPEGAVRPRSGSAVATAQERSLLAQGLRGAPLHLEAAGNMGRRHALPTQPRAYQKLESGRAPGRIRALPELKTSGEPTEGGRRRCGPLALLAAPALFAEPQATGLSPALPRRHALRSRRHLRASRRPDNRHRRVDERRVSSPRFDNDGRVGIYFTDALTVATAGSEGHAARCTATWATAGSGASRTRPGQARAGAMGLSPPTWTAAGRSTSPASGATLYRSNRR